MTGLRVHFLRHRGLAALVLAATLALRLLVPGGMMPAIGASGGLHIVICDGQGDASRLAIPLPGKPVAPADHPCPYVALGHALLAPPPVLAAMPVVVLADGRALPPPRDLALSEISHLRPPARAPPGDA